MELNLEIPTYLWQLCVGVGLLFAVSEVFLPGLSLLPSGIGLLVTAPLAMKAHSLVPLLVFFVFIQVLLFVLFKTAARRRAQDRGFFCGMESLVGCEAQILPHRGGTGNSNYVRIFGDRWRAMGPQGVSFTGGQRVLVRGYDGNTVLVAPIGKLEKNPQL